MERKNKLAVAVIALLAVAAMAIAASQIYSRSVQALSVTAGTATWTNTSTYVALNLQRISVVRNLDATSVVTVARITADSAYTNTICTVTSVGNVGSQIVTNFGMKYGDKLTFANAPATGATVIVEYIVQD